MAKAPTKKQLQELLQKEIASWKQRISELDGVLKEQAIGRKLECEYLLDVFLGRNDSVGEESKNR